MWSLSLFAQLFAADRDDPLTRPEMIWALAGLTGALFVGAIVIYAVDKWRKRAESGADDGTASLTSFRAMFENGEITEAEYAELRRRVAEKVKKGPVPKPDAPAAPLPRAGGMPAPPVFPASQVPKPPAPAQAPAAQSGERDAQN